MKTLSSIRFQLFSYLAFPIILAFRVIPPLIMPSDAAPLSSVSGKMLLDATKWLLFLSVLAIPALMAYRKSHGMTDHDDSHADSDTKDSWIIRWLISGVCGLILLILNNLFWSWIPGASAASPEPAVLPPISFTVICFIAVSALWEELLYRLYLSEGLHSFLPAANSRVSRHRCDAASILIFAFSHRYMGWYAVGNALTAAIIFTVIFRRAGSRRHPWLAVFLTTLIHFSYNLILYLSV